MKNCKHCDDNGWMFIHTLRAEYFIPCLHGHDHEPEPAV